jgi:FMN phosphatase YigB (HAD superfamily)
MKFIFDFDDVLFNNTKEFKPYMYGILEKAGVPRDIAEPYYKQVRVNEFWLKDLLKHFSLDVSLYEKILDKNIIKEFLNKELIDLVFKLGKENCYILTHGGTEFQLDKIGRTGIIPLFSEVISVFTKKTKNIERICMKYKDEQVIFIDDKIIHHDNIAITKCPNLKTILFDEQGLQKLKVEIVK